MSDPFGADGRPVFLYDLGSPYSYLAAERIHEVFEEAPVWQPILLGGLFKANGRTSWTTGPERDAALVEVERRAAEYGLPPIRWPDPLPPESTLFAMRVATYAKEIGRVVAVSLAAFRQAFAAGRDLTDPDTALIAASSCELHPRAVLAGAELSATKATLRAATDQAAALGVPGVPTIVVGEEFFWGDDRLEEAAQAAADSKR